MSHTAGIAQPPAAMAQANFPNVEKSASSAATDRMITCAEQAKLLGDVSSETIRRHLKAKKLPPPDVQLSRQTTAWRLSTLQAAGVRAV